MQKNVSGYQYWFHRRLDYRALVKGMMADAAAMPGVTGSHAIASRSHARMRSCCHDRQAAAVRDPEPDRGRDRHVPADARAAGRSPRPISPGPRRRKEAIEQIRKKLGLDKPLIEQFVRYVADLAHGDFGKSLTTGQPVADRNRNRLPASAELTLLGLIVSMLIARAARHPRRDPAGLVDRPPLPRDDDGGRVAAGVLHRAGAGLRLLFQARLVAGAARTARCLLQRAADGHRLLSDRQP